MTVIADSSFIYALFNTNETRHSDAALFALTNTAPLLVPDIILPEICYLFSRDFGYSGVITFLELYQKFDAPFEPPLKSDLPRMHEIAEAYASAAFDIVDCCIMALAERLQVTRIATFDRRDFSIFRPSHCEFLELLPRS